MRRNDREGRRPQRCGRRGAVAVLAVVAGVGIVCASPAISSHNIPAPPPSVSAPAAAAHTTAPDAALVQAATHFGRFVTAHHPTAAAATAAMLLPLLLARRSPLIPIAVSRRALLRGAPLRRGPPIFRAR